MPYLEETARKPVRLDRLAKAMNVPEAAFRTAVELGGIHVNGRRVRDPRFPVPAGARVSICHSEPPPDFTFDPGWIIHEDDALIVFNKPSGMTKQGTRCFDVGHLYAFAGEYIGGYVGLHHRLDRETSGVVIMSKDRNVNKSLADQFAGRTVDKEYRAVVHGVIGEACTLDAPIGRIAGLQPVRHWVDVPDAKPAETRICPLRTGDTFSLISAHPKTGRTHQVRVHLAATGHPIVGDAFYNSNEAMRSLRVLLHCYEMTLDHPITGDRITFEAPVPQDMQQFLTDHGIMFP